MPLWHSANRISLRVDARDKVTGRTKYAADLVFDGILYTKSVHATSPMGSCWRCIPRRHWRRRAWPVCTPPGTYQAEMWATMRSPSWYMTLYGAGAIASPWSRPSLQEAADRAARLVTYDTQPMPAVFDPEEALLPDAPKLYDDGNLILEHRVRKGRAAKGFDEADIIVEREFRTQRVIPSHRAGERGGVASGRRTAGLLPVQGTLQHPAYRGGGLRSAHERCTGDAARYGRPLAARMTTPGLWPQEPLSRRCTPGALPHDMAQQRDAAGGRKAASLSHLLQGRRKAGRHTDRH